MRFMSFHHEGSEKYGVVHEDGQFVWDIKAIAAENGKECPASLLEGIASGEDFYSKMDNLLKSGASDKHLISLDSVNWLPPIPRPVKNIMCVGKNYRDHAIEMGSEADIPEHVMVFTKAPTTVIGHGGNIEAHGKVTSELDYEGELAIVIGRKGRDIPQEKALDHVFGYTIVNDVTARDLQQRHKQFFIGKSLDSSCPIGPWIVHSSAVGDPNHLDIETRVNGEIRQKSNTSHFIFPAEEIISVLSRGMTLEPGDIIATGTPAGVGKGFKPPRFLSSGDKIEITIQGIGQLNNIVK
ncbi:MAG TPA: fumarylacetoacetate hydrolase family protein [Bacillaceae bacterium]